MNFSALLLSLVLAASPALAADESLGAAANAAYLAAHAKKPGTIVRPSGLQYQVLRSGVGRRPARNDVVQIRYAMRLINGAVVDATTPSLPAAVLLSGISLAGLGEALSLMREGDRWQLAIPPNLGFGAAPAVGGAVPAGQVLVMDVTLVSAVAPRVGEAPPPNPFSLWGNAYTQGAAITIRP
jgi:FKBP-type peptidyl-prolyl cis-trans isomerase